MTIGIINEAIRKGFRHTSQLTKLGFNTTTDLHIEVIVDHKYNHTYPSYQVFFAPKTEGLFDGEQSGQIKGIRLIKKNFAEYKTWNKTKFLFEIDTDDIVRMFQNFASIESDKIGIVMIPSDEYEKMIDVYDIDVGEGKDLQDKSFEDNRVTAENRAIIQDAIDDEVITQDDIDQMSDDEVDDLMEENGGVALSQKHTEEEHVECVDDPDCDCHGTPEEDDSEHNTAAPIPNNEAPEVDVQNDNREDDKARLEQEKRIEQSRQEAFDDLPF